MAAVEELLPEGEKIRKAVRWLSDTVKNHPEKSRQQIIRETETRFDLSPKECDFLQSNFSTNTKN